MTQCDAALSYDQDPVWGTNVTGQDPMWSSIIAGWDPVWSSTINGQGLKWGSCSESCSHSSSNIFALLCVFLLKVKKFHDISLAVCDSVPLKQGCTEWHIMCLPVRPSEANSHVSLE